MKNLFLVSVLILAQSCFSFFVPPIGPPVAPIVPPLLPPVAPFAPPILPAFLPPGLLFARPFLARRLLLTSLLLGKRDVEAHQKQNETSFCTYTKPMINCHGLNRTVNCEVTIKGSELTNLTKKLNQSDLHLTRLDNNVFNLVGENSNFTFVSNIQNKSNLVISIFNSEKITRSGLKVHDLTCWKSFVKLFEESDRVKFELNF